MASNFTKSILLTSFLFLITKSLFAQWEQAQTLTGGSIISDIIEYNGSLYLSTANAGIFKSTDQGNTWTKEQVPIQSNFILFIHQQTDLLALGFGKLFRNTGSDLWNEEPGPDGFIHALSSDGTNIFAATSNGIYKSTDSGKTWQLNPDLETQIDIISIAVRNDTVWAGANYPIEGTLFRSTNGGTSWTKIDMGTDEINDIFIQGNDLYLNIDYKGIYKSSDNGENWQLIRSVNSQGQFYVTSDELYYFSNYRLYISKDRGFSWSEKGESMSFFNTSDLYITDQYIFLGTWGGGIFKTEISGDFGWQQSNNGFAANEINDIEVINSTIYVGTQHNFLHSSDDQGIHWDQKTPPSNFKGSGVQVILSNGSDLYIGDRTVEVSSDNGQTWKFKNQGLIGYHVYGLGNTSTAVFAGTSDGVFRTLNQGDNWTKIANEITAGIRTIYSSGENIYVGTWEGLYHSNNNGDTWKKISSGLPSESIGYIVQMGDIVFAATQFDGLYKTSDMGTKWDFVSSESVQSLAVKNDFLFLGTLEGKLFYSDNKGESLRDITGNLDDSYISAIDFTDENLVVGKYYGSGIWLRKITELMPPTLQIFSNHSDSSVYLDSLIFIKSDQQLYTLTGEVVNLEDLRDYIKIKDSYGTEFEFLADIKETNKLITLEIKDAKVGDTLLITVLPFKNEAGLTSQEITRAFKAITNQPPAISDISIEIDQDEVFYFSDTSFLNAFSDPDSNLLATIVLNSLPSHGTLKLDNVPVSINTEIPKALLAYLSYTPEKNFSGNDQWTWNASDGIVYADLPAQVNIKIAPVTAISNEPLQAKIKIYPNPIRSQLHIENRLTSAFELEVLDISGRIVYKTMRKNKINSAVSFDFSAFPAGIYIINIGMKHQQIQQKVIKLK